MTFAGKPQPTNGHTWHFAQYLHPTINMEGIRKYKDPANSRFFQEVARNPRDSFGILPFSDTEITHYYKADPEIAATFAKPSAGRTIVSRLCFSAVEGCEM